MTVIKDQQHLARKAEQQLLEAERKQFLEAEAQAVAGAPVESNRVRTDGGEDEVQNCPRCGEPVKAMSVSGPSEAYLMPCGHTVPADFVRDEEEDDR